MSMREPTDPVRMEMEFQAYAGNFPELTSAVEAFPVMHRFDLGDLSSDYLDDAEGTLEVDYPTSDSSPIYVDLGVTVLSVMVSNIAEVQPASHHAQRTCIIRNLGAGDPATASVLLDDTPIDTGVPLVGSSMDGQPYSVPAMSSPMHIIGKATSPELQLPEAADDRHFAVVPGRKHLIFADLYSTLGSIVYVPCNPNFRDPSMPPVNRYQNHEIQFFAGRPVRTTALNGEWIDRKRQA